VLPVLQELRVLLAHRVFKVIPVWQVLQVHKELSVLRGLLEPMEIQEQQVLRELQDLLVLRV